MIKKFYSISISLIVLIIYVLTLAKTTVSLDNGELAATSYFLGIPHPTGYPLFTIIGFLFSRIPIPIRIIQKLNLLSALYVTIGVYFTIKIIKLLLDEFEKQSADKNDTKTSLYEELKIIISIFGGLVFAFSKTLWFQSTNYEVYSLNIALISMIIFYSLKAYFNEQTDSAKVSGREWLFVSVLFGLLLSHHLSGSFVIFPIAFLYFLNFSSYKFYNLLKYISVTLLVVIVFYTFIPIRALMDPVVGFGKPENFVQSIDHITAKIYRPFFFSSSDKFFNNLNFFSSSLLFHFNIYDFNNSEFNVNILFIIFGLIYSFLYFRKFFYFLFGLLITYIVIPSFYGIQDNDAYFLPAYFSISIFISLGVYSIIKQLNNNKLKKIFVLALVVLLMVQFYFNFFRVDQSKNYLMEDYFSSIVKELETGAVVLNSSSWLHSMSLYFQLVEKKRSDVVFVNYSFAKEKWYAEQVNNLFAKEKLIYLNGNNLQLNFKNRATYFTYEIFKKIQAGELNFSGNYFLIPFGLTFKLSGKSDYVPQPIDLYNLRFDKMNYAVNEELKLILMEMILRRINYEIEYGQEDRANQLINLFIKKFGIKNLPQSLINH